MFAWLNQVVRVSWMNLLNIRQRSSTSLVIVVSIAGVVGVLTAILSMNEGFQITLGKGGREDRAIVMRNGANSELSSSISREQADLIQHAQGVARDSSGKPIAAAELLVIADLPKIGSNSFANAALRGVGSGSFALRPEVKIISGRPFSAGTRELIVGRQAAQQFVGMQINSRISFRDADWTVVGIFEANGGVHESEMWADAETLMSSYRRNNFQSVSLALTSTESFATFKQALSAEPRMQVNPMTLKQYFASQSASLGKLITILGFFVGLIMAIGAIFGALNTMYSAVSARAREIAILRALGFGTGPILISVMIEALLLAALGGAIGAALAYLLFNNYTASTLGANFSQVAFDFRVTPSLMMQGMIWSLCIGFIGGLLPAWSAGRMQVAKLLRSH